VSDIWADFYIFCVFVVTTHGSGSFGTSLVINRNADNSLQVLVITQTSADRNVRDVDLSKSLRSMAAVVDWAGATQRCEHFKPTAICTPMPQTGSDAKICQQLRSRHADIPIIGYAESDEERNNLLRVGIADIAVHQAELSEPSVTRLLEQAIAHRSTSKESSSRPANRISAPLAQSRMIGSIIASSAGVIQSANTCVAKWLGYPRASNLIGVNFVQRHLKRSSDWAPLARAADDQDALIRRELSALDVDNRSLAFRVEVSADPACSMLLRLLFLDITRQQLYKAALDVAYQKLNHRREVLQ